MNFMTLVDFPIEQGTTIQQPSKEVGIIFIIAFATALVYSIYSVIKSRFKKNNIE